MEQNISRMGRCDDGENKKRSRRLTVAVINQTNWRIGACTAIFPVLVIYETYRYLVSLGSSNPNNKNKNVVEKIAHKVYKTSWTEVNYI